MLHYTSNHQVQHFQSHLMAQRPDRETGWKQLKPKLCLEWRNAGNLKSVPTSKCLWLLWMAFALSGSHSIICFSICGWSAVGPSNILQEHIWGDNLGKQWAFALFPEQHHHQNFLKSKPKTQQSAKGSSPGQAATWKVARAALPPTNVFLHHPQISHWA